MKIVLLSTALMLALGSTPLEALDKTPELRGVTFRVQSSSLVRSIALP